MNKKRAFTTPELLMTIVVFSFGILPLIVLFQSSHKQTAQAKNLMVAQSLGRTIISEIKALGFDALEQEMKSPKLGIVHTGKPVEGPLVIDDVDSINTRNTTSDSIPASNLKEPARAQPENPGRA